MNLGGRKKNILENIIYIRPAFLVPYIIIFLYQTKGIM